MRASLLAISFSAYTAGVVGSLACADRGPEARRRCSVWPEPSLARSLARWRLRRWRRLSLPWSVRAAPARQVSIDALSGFFLVLTGLVGAAAAVYAFGYTDSYRGGYSERTVGAVLNVLLLSFTGVVVAANDLTFPRRVGVDGDGDVRRRSHRAPPGGPSRRASGTSRFRTSPLSPSFRSC
ncbi:MAG: hypothetical protein IPF53_18045 [Blastocatellia bacterium]|nr:hypothetical protein [Blastocatellia bacterium]